MKLTHNHKLVTVSLRNGNSIEVLRIKDVLDVQSLPQEKVIVIVKKDGTFLTISTDLILEMDITHFYGYDFMVNKEQQEKEVKA